MFFCVCQSRSLLSSQASSWEGNTGELSSDVRFEVEFPVFRSKGERGEVLLQRLHHIA